MTDLVTLENDLRSAVAQRIERAQRRRRRLSVTAVSAVIATGLCAAAVASGIAGDLGLDPTKWEVLGGGSVDDGRGAYVHAQSKADGGNSTFMVEHDAGLTPYRAFLLHEQTLAAAQESSPVLVKTERGELCTAEQLTRAESVAYATLRATFPPNTDADATKPTVDAAVDAAFAGSPCKGLEYSGEQARLVWAGAMPAKRLMPGAR
jgi:hypothetical protein